MNGDRPNDPFDRPRPDDEIAGDAAGAAGPDILIGRLVDLEASSNEQDEFEQLAARDPGLWRTLALKQRDMMMLADRLDEQTQFADQVDLPNKNGGLNVRWPWLTALSGLAAVLAIVLVWKSFDRVNELPESLPTGRAAVSLPPAEMTADEYFSAYLTAGRESGQIINVMPSALLEQVELPDGRVKLRIIRRVEESLIVDQAPELDELGNLKGDASDLRARSPVAPTTDSQQ